MLSASRLTPYQVLCPWTPLGAPLPDPHYRLALHARHVLPTSFQAPHLPRERSTMRKMMSGFSRMPLSSIFSVTTNVVFSQHAVQQHSDILAANTVGYLIKFSPIKYPPLPLPLRCTIQLLIKILWWLVLPSVLWHCWLGLLTYKTRPRYDL